jgi:4a-hydroxytetrahydrobiopterin dehydratase
MIPTTLLQKTCTPCEGGVAPLDPAAAQGLLAQVPGWSIADDGRSLRREWVARDFAAAAGFFREVAAVAEAEGHHPDFHLTGYREVAVDLTTHAVGGLTENDFILAAKIDAIPFEARPPGPPGH